MGSRRLLGSAAVLFAAATLALAPAGAATAFRNAGTAALQVALRARGFYPGTIDGIKGAATNRALKRFQQSAGLPADGKLDPATRRALGPYGRHLFGTRTLARGATGWDVAALQFLLARHGFPSGPVDGDLGPRGQSALLRFQAWAGLAADGVAGPATLRALRRGPPRSILRFAWPIAAPIGDRFGPRGAMFHTGLDFPAPYGTPVSAAGYGCVASVGWDPSGYGNLVVIRHRFGMTSWYAHLSSIAVSRGTCLLAGARVGTVGATGRATGPHLHFELRLRGAAVDPLTGL